MKIEEQSYFYRQQSSSKILSMTGAAFLGNIGDVFAADILYHKNCMRSSYILKFDREVDQLINSHDTVIDNSTKDVFNRVITNLDVSNKIHYVSNV